MTPGLRLAYCIYQAILHLALPVFLTVLLLRSRNEPLYRANLGQRFGRVLPRSDEAILVFAASLGEVRAASIVIRQLLGRGEKIVLTHSSPAGLSEARRLFGPEITSGQIIHAYMPVDLWWVLRRFFRHHKFRLGLVVEAELWPGLMIEATRAGISMVQINGNYTERAFERDTSGMTRMRGRIWALYSLIITKSDERADRYRRVGVAPVRIKNVGELKFDLPVRDDLRTRAEEIRLTDINRPVLTIASSIEHEEVALLSVLTHLRDTLATPPLVVWVPRSPQRFQEVADLLTAKGYRTTLRSDAFDSEFGLNQGLSSFDVIVGNSLREMDFYYTLADVVFVGATLHPMGGHNIIESLALERPVVTGPSIYGIAYPAYEAIDAGALRCFDDADALAHGLATLFSDDRELHRFKASTKGFNTSHRGASARTIEALAPYLSQQILPGSQSESTP